MNVIRGERLNYGLGPASPESVLLFTGNGYVKHNGALTMGRGAAKEVRDSFPGIDKEFGTAIKQVPYRYGVMILDARRIGVFQVKRDFRDRADLRLIAYSAACLWDLATDAPDHTFDCNYPGIGWGQRNVRDVEAVLKEANLPDNVYFWREDCT